GNGIVTYSITANSTSTQRSGTLGIAGLTFTVTQSPAVMVSISPVSASTQTGGAQLRFTATVSNTSYLNVDSSVSGRVCNNCKPGTLPPGCACNFSAPTITPGPSAVNFTLTITTKAASAGITRPRRGQARPLVYAAFLPLMGMVLLGAASKTKRSICLFFSLV